MKKIVAIALVVVLVFAMASVAFAVTSPEKNNTNPNVKPDGKTSPQTGEPVSVLWVILSALILMAVAVFCGAKLVKVK